MELSLREVEEITPEEADTMIDLKTGALLRLACDEVWSALGLPAPASGCT